jgi:hypothetical protein
MQQEDVPEEKRSTKGVENLASSLGQSTWHEDILLTLQVHSRQIAGSRLRSIQRRPAEQTSHHCKTNAVQSAAEIRWGDVHKHHARQNYLSKHIASLAGTSK